MVLLNPEHSGRNEEACYLVTAVVEDVCAPLLVLTDSPVLILVAACAVKASETVSVLGEVSRNPVEDNADAFLVAAVDKVHQVLGLAVTRGSGKVTCNLISPASVKRILGKRHKLNVGVAHIFNVGYELVSQLAVAELVAVLKLAP